MRELLELAVIFAAAAEEERDTVMCARYDDRDVVQAAAEKLDVNDVGERAAER